MNEHNEPPGDVLIQYIPGDKKPAFLNDPVRAYYANKNGGK